MNKKNKLRAIVAIVVALAFIAPSAAVFANFGAIGIISNSENTVDIKNTMETGNTLVRLTGNIIYVGGTGPGNYSTIQEGINAANAGDTVYVYNGTYSEHVMVNKQLDLIGESRENVIVDGEGWAQVVKVAVNVNYVSIDSFTMTNGSYGIYLYKASNCNITNCKVYNNNGNGIRLANSPNSKLRGNSIYDNVYNFGVAGGPIGDFYHDIDTSNTVNGKPIRYLVEQSNLTIDNFGYLALISCTNITAKNGDVNDVLVINTTDSTISDVDSHNGRYGIYLWMSPDNNITNCNAYTNTGGGIRLDSSSNCTIANCNASYISYGGGICLDSSSNCTITNCNAYNNSHDGIVVTTPSGFTSTSNNITNCNAYNNSGDGIYFDGSSNNNNIINCNAYNNYRNGIYLDGSSNNNIINCSTYNNSIPYTRQGTGIYIWLASNNNIINCDTYDNNYGIYFYYSSNNKLDDNTIHDNVYDFHVEGKTIIHFRHDIDTSNMINGKPMYYLIDQENIILDENDNFGYLGLISCTNITAKNGDVSGVLLACTTDSTISNVVSHNSKRGIYLFMLSLNNNITNCNVYNNDYGVYLSKSRNNLIYNNYFADNMVNAWDDTGMGNNIWNIAKTAGTNIIGGPFLGGNFWSDYAGEDLYGDGLGDTLLPYTCGGKIKKSGDYLPLVPVEAVEYTLVITTAGSGTVNCDPAGDPPGTYEEGTLVALTPEPVAGWAFDDWSGPDASEIEGSTITMTKNMEITATFVQKAIVSISPETQTVNKGQAFTFSVYVEPSDTPIMGIGFRTLFFNQTIIYVDSIAKGDIVDPDTWLTFIFGDINNTVGEIEDTLGAVDPDDVITTSGSFLVVSCHALQELGTSDLVLYGVDVSDVDAQPIPTTVIDGEVVVRIEDTQPPITTCILDPPEPDGDNGWYISVVTVTLNAMDDVSGVNYTMYKLDDGEWETYDEPFVVSDDGEHTVYFYSVDKDENIEVTQSVDFKIDTTLPATMHEFDGVMGENGWYTSDVMIVLNAEDETSGVDYTMYKVDDGEWIEYTGPFYVTEDGMHILYYYSVDFAGNEESANEVDFKIDQTPPVTTCELDGDSIITVTLIAIDETSGVAYTMYKLDDGTYAPYVEPFVVDEKGEHTVCFYSVDNAGNEEDEKSCTFTVTAELTVEISGGFGVTATIKNVGDVDAVGVEWSITFDGGFILVPRGGVVTGTVDIPAGEEAVVKSFVFGIGRMTITVTANDVEETAKGFVLLCFVLGVQQTPSLYFSRV